MAHVNEVSIGKLIMSLSDEEIEELFLRVMCSVVAQVTSETWFEGR